MYEPLPDEFSKYVKFNGHSLDNDTCNDYAKMWFRGVSTENKARTGPYMDQFK